MVAPREQRQTVSRDAVIRKGVGGLPFPVRDATPVAEAKPLSQAKVAIVTTAGFRPAGSAEVWQPGDVGYQEFSSDVRDMQLSHFSPNFDRVGVAQDLNVVYPIDRLDELAADGVIGSVNHRHFSFMGAQFDLSAILADSGPAVAQQLLADEVDIVLLTPV